jgi:hypothetical protein
MSNFYYPQEQYCKETHWTQPSHLFSSHKARIVEIELYSKCLYCHHHVKVEIVECDRDNAEDVIQYATTLGFRDLRLPF